MELECVPMQHFLVDRVIVEMVVYHKGGKSGVAQQCKAWVLSSDSVIHGMICKPRHFFFHPVILVRTLQRKRATFYSEFDPHSIGLFLTSPA